MMTVVEEDSFTIDYSDLEAKYAATPMETAMNNVLIIKNLPQVDSAKEDKLLGVIQKNVFGKDAKVVPGGIFMPKDDVSGMSKGYMFAEFETAEQAEHVLKHAQGFKLDKSHVLACLRFEDLEEALKMDTDFTEPTLEPFEEKEYLRSWLADSQARDQFLTHQLGSSTITVQWNSNQGTPQIVAQRTNWADAGCTWSSRGSYLATMHHQGVALWGGDAFKKMARLPHSEVQRVLFSPSEKFMLSTSPKTPAEDNVLLWDLTTSKLVRGFHMAWEDAERGRFSATDAYFARSVGDELFVHELPTGSLLDKKPMRLEGLQGFAWSPTDSALLFYWTLGSDNHPSRLSLLNVQTREVLRSKNIYLVESCQLEWQSEGDYVAVVVNRTSKTKQQPFTSLELFRIRERGVPVDFLEWDTTLAGFYWQPGGAKFLTHVNRDFSSQLTLYAADEIEENGLQVLKPLKTLERKQITTAAFAPKGDFVALAGVLTSATALEFWQVTSGPDYLALLASREHYLASELAWEPAGRFLATWVNVRRHTMDNSVAVWDLKGDLVVKLPMPKLLQFAWRPRPPNLLSKEDIKAIRKNLKQLSARYEQEDAQSLANDTVTAEDVRRRLLDEWQAFRQSAQEAYDTRRGLRESILQSARTTRSEAGEPFEYVEEWLEEVIEEQEVEVEEQSQIAAPSQ